MRLKWSILRNSRWQKEKETKKNKNERGKEESDKHWKKPAIKNTCFLPWRLPCPPQKKKKKKKKKNLFSSYFEICFGLQKEKWIRIGRKMMDSIWEEPRAGKDQCHSSVQCTLPPVKLQLLVVALAVSLLVNSNFGVGLRQITPAKKAPFAHEWH